MPPKRKNVGVKESSVKIKAETSNAILTRRNKPLTISQITHGRIWSPIWPFKRICVKTLRLLKTYLTESRFTIRKTLYRMNESTSGKRRTQAAIHHLRSRPAIFFSWFSSVFFWVDFLISPLFPLSGWFSLHFPVYFFGFLLSFFFFLFFFPKLTVFFF